MKIKAKQIKKKKWNIYYIKDWFVKIVVIEKITANLIRILEFLL